MNDDLTAEKNRLRREIRAKLRAMAAEERAEKSKIISRNIIDILERIEPENCLLYNALPSEVDVSEVIKHCIDKGIVVYLPRVNGEEMEIVPYGECAMGAYGISEPVGSASSVIPEVAITPLLGADKHKNRLGKGKGYYDRYFCGKEIYKIGAAFACQIADHVPTDGGDVPLDELVFA